MLNGKEKSIEKRHEKTLKNNQTESDYLNADISPPRNRDVILNNHYH